MSQQIASRIRLATIQTLDPSKLSSSEFIDASLKLKIRAYGRDKSFFNANYHGCSKFPEGTRGFLYYHSSGPPAAGQIRFRLTPGNDPAYFTHGSDLLCPNGLPWAIHLLAMAGSQKKLLYQPIRKLLIDDGLVAPALLEKWDTNELHLIRSSRIIHSFGQPFAIKFDVENFDFHLPMANQLQFQRFLGLFCRHRRFAPYSGGHVNIACLIPTLN
jgi:hypothetical protein